MDPPTLFSSRATKNTKLSSSTSTLNLGARLCSYHYVVSLAESITTWPQSRAASFVVVTAVCLWRKCPSTCSSPEVRSCSWAANFPSSFRMGSSSSTPCSSSRNPVSISKSSSLTSPHLYRLITVRALFLRLPHLVPSSPSYNCRCSCLLSTEARSFNCPVANTDVCKAFDEIYGF